MFNSFIDTVKVPSSLDPDQAQGHMKGNSQIISTLKEKKMMSAEMLDDWKSCIPTE